MNDKYLKDACKKIPDRTILVTIAARRAKELAHGSNPMIQVDRSKAISHLDVALQEIAEGKITFELPDDDE